MARTTTYTDLIGRHHSVTRYDRGEELSYRPFVGAPIDVVAVGPGDPMEPNCTPVRVMTRDCQGFPFGSVFVAANDDLTPR